ncbi:EamA-like transporter family protein [Bryocella elongata]|uniref:EamA-like transporter family protein n=1 Tax=Bryocella elongata TaxID=863522 RepID=A0A1H5UD05_9BACT|nr:EamA family transporter [Bryocella elongata]SEF72288.1 EamA-like transporter family protein [Bryocella elongata]
MQRVLAYAAIYLFWGASFLAIRVVVADVPPIFAAGVRFFLAGLLLVAYAFARRLTQPKGIEWRNLIVVALILFVGDYALLFLIEQRLVSGLAAVTAATIPAQIFVFEWLWVRRVRMTAMTGLGLLLGLGGVVALSLPANFLVTHKGLNRYVLLGFLAATFWAFGTVLSTRLTLPKSRPVLAGWQMTVGGLALLALSGASREWGHVSIVAFTPKVIWSMLYLIFFASLLAFSAYVYLLQHEPARRVASYAYVNPVLALILGAVLAGETLSPRQYVACGVIVAGVLITLLGRDAAIRPTRA